MLESPWCVTLLPPHAHVHAHAHAHVHAHFQTRTQTPTFTLIVTPTFTFTPTLQLPLRCVAHCAALCACVPWDGMGTFAPGVSGPALSAPSSAALGAAQGDVHVATYSNTIYLQHITTWCNLSHGGGAVRRSQPHDETSLIAPVDLSIEVLRNNRPDKVRHARTCICCNVCWAGLGCMLQHSASAIIVPTRRACCSHQLGSVYARRVSPGS
jgi:hypothetical protein